MSTIAGQHRVGATAHSAETARAPSLRAAGLGKWIDGREVLRAIDLEIQAGECVALLGSNGAGKTTLLRIGATLTPPSSGRLELFGRAVGRDSAAARARIGLVGHQLMLYRGLTVRENLELFARLYGVERPAERANELIALVGLEGRGEDAVRALSRGMAQRAAIARALVHEPDLLLADEPFTGLDAASAGVLERVLGAAGERGRAVLFATHDVGQALRLADRVVVLGAGAKVLDERAERLTGPALLEMLGGRA